MTKFKKAAINAATIIAVAATVGASIFMGCDGFANEPNESGDGTAAGPERKAAAARFGDGDYTFYFKNGATASGDCDGYSSEYGGKTTIYEWYQSDINEWEKRLLSAGVKPEMYKTSSPHYCWARFPTELIYGTGHIQNGVLNRGTAYFRMNGKETRVKWAKGLRFAEAGKDFIYISGDNKEYAYTPFSKAHKDAAVPELALETYLFFGSEKSLVKPLRDAGYSFEVVKNNDRLTLINASDVEWFAYDYDH
ncbi:hypothetical protein [Treponema endosymbiont of Eucomonympha sp.]|uniref:hypothetical protein n=1 Tax=Treponema endosymbiont of Eucomonympha sp. TaxID=1580831 RepID=UPI000785F93C|nr:hypothetical protein [Treponema endosymbiont of Eucomonympha sp.]